jgi:HAD superfamily hydrolase (TIGR01509 family)
MRNAEDPHTPSKDELEVAMTLAAVLWDMDGTLVDTEPLWAAARARLASHYGIPWTEADAKYFVGKPMPLSAEEMRRRGVDIPADRIIDELVQEVLDGLKIEIVWRPGARELVASLADAGIPCALVTMAYSPVAFYVAAQTHPSAFEAVVAGDHITLGKPHPEPYLRAAAALGVDAAECIAIEDTENGALSAQAAGMPVLVVPSVGRIVGGDGRLLSESLAGFDAERLRAVHRELHAT